MSECARLYENGQPWFRYVTNSNNIEQNKEGLEELTDDVTKNMINITKNTNDIKNTCRKVKNRNWRHIKLDFCHAVQR